MPRTTIQDLARLHAAGERIPVLTAYDHPSARLAETAGVRVLLVGDSLGMVVHGETTTLPVTLEDMVRASRSVVRGAPQSLVITDLPFLSYATEERALHAAGRAMQEAGVQAVKLEGGAPILPIVRRLAELGVPVMGHLGFTPQSQHQIGLRVQASQAATARQLIADALALEAAGAFAVVLELVPAPLAAHVTERLGIPTIGIGAGPGCSGQVQVWHDLLGLYGDKPPRHARRYADVGATITTALAAYVQDVRDGRFPTDAQAAAMDAAELSAATRPDG
jgi:3-methyl-2-oxobutanoate hydroxymethyltransferase